MLAHLVVASVMLATPPKLVARVGEEEIGLEEVSSRIAAARARNESTSAEQIAEQLVAQALLAIDSRRAGIASDAAVRRAVDRERRRAMVEQFLERDVGDAIGDAALRRLYHELSDAVELDAVVLATEKDAAEAAARLARGGALADEGARSLDPEGKRRGGALGRRTRGQLDPALAAAAFSAPVGSFQGPVALPLGHAIFRVRARHIADEGRFAAEREGLYRFAHEQARSHVRARHVARLRATTGVKMDEAFLASAAADDGASARAHVVATVGAVPLRYDDVIAELQRLASAGAAAHASSPRAKIDLAWALVDRMLLEDEANRALAADPAARTRARAAERAALSDAWVEHARRHVRAPDDTEKEAFYRARRADYSVGAFRRCSQIVTSSRESADAIVARLAAGEAFEDLARRFSLDPATRSRGGVIGDVTESRLDALSASEPDIVAAVRGARPGRPTRPARSAGGWHVFRCEKPVPTQVRRFAEVKDEIDRRIRAERLEASVERRVGELRREIPIQIENDELRRLGAAL